MFPLNFIVTKFGSKVLSTVIHQMWFWHWKHNNINNSNITLKMDDINNLRLTYILYAMKTKVFNKDFQSLLINCF